MIEKSDHYRIVNESLSGNREFDDQTLSSLAVLGERLDRVKHLHSQFDGISFSLDVEAVKSRKNLVAVI